MTRLIIEQLPYYSDSLVLAERFIDLPYAVFLDSAQPQSAQGRFDLIAADPVKRIRFNGTNTEISTEFGTEISNEDPFKLLNKLATSLSQTQKVDNIPFIGGIIAMFSYDLGRQLEVLPNKCPSDSRIPDLFAGLYLWAVIQDHQKKVSWLVAQPETPASTIAYIRHRADPSYSTYNKHEIFTVTNCFESNLTKLSYSEAFNRIQRYIRAGDCYQVNLAQRLSAPCRGSSWDGYKKIRRFDNSPFSAFFDIGEAQILSFSPERFIEVDQGRVESKPIKGTRKKGSSDAEDALIIEQLLNSPKDRAENLMIVDLLRNDLGKNCIPGSINVEKMFSIESFSKVHHMVSTVSGQLKAECSPMELLKGCFPGGSITGAPKIRAMEIIEELEPNHRSIYCGSIAYLSADGKTDSNIAIRTLLRKDDSIYCWGGGGIVADSVCEQEYQESMDKIEHLLKAL